MKRMVILGILTVVALVVASATPVAMAQGKVIRIGMVNFSQCCPYFIGMDKAVKEEAAVYPNIEVISTDANGDAEKLTSDVEDVIAKGVDGIILSGAWLEAAPAALEAIEKAGIPVVLVDRKLKGGNYTSWVGPDNYGIGVQVGQYIADRLGGKGLLVVLRGGPADNSIGLDRTNGVLSIVQKTDIQVEMAPDWGGWSSDGGFKLMENMLAKFDKIDAVFCENDSMCLGAQKAIADAGRSDEMFLCGVDGEKAALVAIMTEGSNYACTGRNNSDQIGRAAFHRLMAILAGAQAPKDTILPSPLITKDNVIKFYDPESVF
ncbi:MAG: substrate-binding domain-containing protein [Anaerolineae bacterium]|nr:substrate-binding domain-containing protein [Anaerolineae bacterium]MDW8070514.1 substrate-binding domain-containing protein [Anaerolineae bacterium]